MNGPDRWFAGAVRWWPVASIGLCGGIYLVAMAQAPASSTAAAGTSAAARPAVDAGAPAPVAAPAGAPAPAGPGTPAAVAGKPKGPVPPGMCFNVYQGTGRGAPVPAGGKITTSYGFSVLGKLKYPAGFKHFDYVNPNAPKGGSMRYSMAGTFDNLNGYIVLGTTPLLLVLSSPDRETLMARSLDEQAAQYGWLAESITYPKDLSWVQYRINPKARWHDGVPVTADDVVFSVDFLMTKASPAFRFRYPCLTRIEKIDRLTVRFVFADHDNLTQALNAGDTPILPKHYFDKVDITKPSLVPILGSGAMRVAKVDPGRSIVYQRVKNYWGKDLPVSVGRNNFETLEIEFFRDEAAAFEAFMAGGLDFRGPETPPRWVVDYNRPAVRKGWIKKRAVRTEAAGAYWGLSINNRLEKFKDPRVREALSYALDFGFINRALFYGMYTRVNSYFPQSIYEAQGAPTGRELELLKPFRDKVDPRVFTTKYEPPDLDGTWASRRANLTKAYALLKQAGYVVRDGRLVKASTGVPFTIEIVIQEPSAINVLGTYARNLATLGIRADIKMVDSSQYLKRVEQKDFDMMLGIPAFPVSIAPGAELRSVYDSAGAMGRGNSNLPGIMNPAVDAMLNKLISDPSMAEKRAAGRALDRVLSWGFYSVPLYRLPTINYAYWDKYGQPKIDAPYGTVLSPPTLWWASAEKEAALERARRGKPAQEARR